MTKGTFGDNLKREREMRGVTLDEISAATRIATRFLQAIENEDWAQLPGGVFNRGFVRAVARYLGLDEENIVAEYTLAVGDRPSVPVWTGSPPAVTPEQPWLAWFLAAVVLIALLAGAWFGTRWLLAWRAERQTTEPTTATSPTPSASDTTSDPQAADVAPPADDAPATGNATARAAGPPEAPAVASDLAKAAPAESAPNDPIKLKIETGKRTKVVVMADNEVVFDGTMKAGENHFFSATDHFQISAKDAGALHLDLNGKPLAPIGPPGHSAKVTLTRDALKGVTGGAN
jgi:cytoskeletal protein RodZ